MESIELKKIESRYTRFYYYQRGSMWVFKDNHGNLAIGNTLEEAGRNYKVTLDTNRN